MRLHPLFHTGWSPFPLWGVIPQDSPSLRSAAPVLGGPRLGGALDRFTGPLRPHGRSPTPLIPLHHWEMHIAALTLSLASRSSLGLPHTDRAVFLSTAHLAEFPLRLAMGGTPAVTTLGRSFRPRPRTDALLILEGARSQLVLRCPLLPPPPPPHLPRFSMGEGLTHPTTSKVQARILRSGGAARLSPLGQFTSLLLLPGESLLPPSRLWRRLLLTLFLFPSTASLSRRSRRRMIISLRGI